MKENLITNTFNFLQDNFQNLELLANGAKKAAKYKRKDHGYCYKTVFGDDDGSESEDDQIEDDQIEDETEVDKQFPSFTARNCMSTKKGQKFCIENNITAEDLEKLEEQPLTISNVMKYLSVADE